MSLVDPQAVDIGGGSVSLPRTSTGNNESTYTSADGLITLKLSTSKGKRQRQVIRVDVSKITADPFIPAQNQEVSTSLYVVADRPVAGFTNTEMLNIFLGLVGQMTASTNKVAIGWLGGQS